MAKAHSIIAKLRHMQRCRDGAAAIEFAMLALPFFAVIFAILETFVAMIAEQVLANATDKMARQLRTGQISKTITEAEFRSQLCAEIAVIIRCTEGEIKVPTRLYVDLRSFTDFDKMPSKLAFKSHSTGRDIDTSGFSFSPGGPGTKNMLRVYYRWPVVTDFVRPYLTNIKPAGNSLPSHSLLVATNAFVAEAY
jgi:Flp pilus assembly protein TadG